MGKWRSKNRRSRARIRPQPTGLPSVKEAVQQQQMQPSKASKTTILNQLSHASPKKREWACSSLCHLIEEEKALNKLMANRLVRKVSCLLLDPVPAVRVAAAGMLRNLSLVVDENQCRSMVDQDIMTPLAAMIRDCLTKLDHMQTKKHSINVRSTEEASATPSEEGGKTEGAACIMAAKKPTREKSKAEIEEEQWYEVLEQGLHLLWNVTERSDLVVKVFNKEPLLPAIMTILQPSLYPDRIIVLAAQVLQTVTENNVPVVSEICSSSQLLSQLEALLQETQTNDPIVNSFQLLTRSCIAGVFHNLLPGLPNTVQSQTFRGVLSFLSSVLDIDVLALVSTTKPVQRHQGMATSRDIEPSDSASAIGESAVSKPTSSLHKVNCKDQEKSVQVTLSAMQVALETLANICYVEDTSNASGDDWEDADDEDDDIIGDDDNTLSGGEGEEVADMETDNTVQHKASGDDHDECSADLLILAELGIHEKVWKLSCLDVICCQQESDPSVHESLSVVQSRSLIAFQNLLSVLPLDRWGSGCGLPYMWTTLYTQCSHCTDVNALAGVLQVIAEKMTEDEASCVTLDQLHLLCQVGLTFDERSTKVTIMSILGRLGKLVLGRRDEGVADMLQLIGSTLRDCISSDVSAWVVCQALDSIYDLFGDDRCPPSLCVSLSLLPALKQLATVIKEKYRVERKFLRTMGDQRALVQNARANLPRFIDYMTTRCQT